MTRLLLAVVVGVVGVGCVHRETRMTDIDGAEWNCSVHHDWNREHADCFPMKRDEPRP